MKKAVLRKNLRSRSAYMRATTANNCDFIGGNPNI